MISHIKFVSVPVRDQNRALDFYTEKLGFTIITDQPFDEKQRWIELRIPKAETPSSFSHRKGRRIGSVLFHHSSSPARTSRTPTPSSRRVGWSSTVRPRSNRGARSRSSETARAISSSWELRNESDRHRITPGAKHQN
jgi:catechol 2,3-dioxygenase-like lactoylglutathione lyase family enzyme